MRYGLGIAMVFLVSTILISSCAEYSQVSKTEPDKSADKTGKTTAAKKTTQAASKKTASAKTVATQTTEKQAAEKKSTFTGAATVKTSSETKKSSSGSKKDSSENKAPNLDVPDKNIAKGSGLNNNLVDLFAYSSDDKTSQNDLSFSIKSQSNTEVVSCYIEYDRYVDCTPKEGRAGYSKIELAISDGKLSYEDVFIVTVSENGEYAEAQQPVVAPVNPPGDSARNATNATKQNNPPSFGEIANQAATSGQEFYLQISGSDPDGDAVVFSDSTSLFEITRSGIIRFTPSSAQAGTYTITITANDGKISFSRSFSLVISSQQTPSPPESENLPENRAPTLSSIGSQAATVGTRFTLTVSASDPDGDSLSYSDNTNLFNIGQNGVISFIPISGNEGTHSITITVSDGKATASRSFSLTINPEVIPGVNRAPVLNSIPFQVATSGKHYDYDVIASDPDDDSLSYSDNTNLFNIDPDEGYISFVPKESDVGTHTVTITVSDGELSASKSFVILITKSSSPPGTPEGTIQSPFGNAAYTSTWRSYHGNVKLSGADAQPGDEIGAFDNNGVLCGKFIVKKAGEYGLLHVYGDDPSTGKDEGPESGEDITFKIWDKSQNQVYASSLTEEWEGDMGRVEIDISSS